METIAQSIKKFIDVAKSRHLDVEGNPEQAWFAVNHLKLDQCFTVPETRVIFKLRTNLDALILIPEHVQIKPEAKISGDFIVPVMHPVGWNGIFPGIFLDVNNDIPEFVLSVAGALANLSLYNLCSENDIYKQAEVIPVEVNRVQETTTAADSQPSAEQEST